MGGFISGISVFCFAASYGVSLALEISRLLFRSGVRGAVMIGFAAAGLLAHTLFLAYRASTSSDLPLSSAFDWYLMAAWILSAAYLYLTLLHPRTAIGVFVLPVVLALIGVAEFLADPQPFAQSRDSALFGMVHGGLFLAGTVMTAAGFLGGLMYLVQAARLKRKRPAIRGLRLPSLELLERVNHWALIASVLSVGTAIGLGIVHNLLTLRLEWTDPVVVCSLAVLAWLCTVAVFHLLYKPARQGRKLAYLTITTGFGLAAYLAVVLLVPTGHGV
jgi:hypothetical protein